MSRAPLDSCVCGGCVGCPDGWHSDDEPCDCTADCVLGEDDCDDCGYSSRTGDHCNVCDGKDSLDNM